MQLWRKQKCEKKLRRFIMKSTSKVIEHVFLCCTMTYVFLKYLESSMSSVKRLKFKKNKHKYMRRCVQTSSVKIDLMKTLSFLRECWPPWFHKKLQWGCRVENSPSWPPHTDWHSHCWYKYHTHTSSSVSQVAGNSILLLPTGAPYWPRRITCTGSEPIRPFSGRWHTGYF